MLITCIILVGFASGGWVNILRHTMAHGWRGITSLADKREFSIDCFNKLLDVETLNLNTVFWVDIDNFLMKDTRLKRFQLGFHGFHSLGKLKWKVLF